MTSMWERIALIWEWAVVICALVAYFLIGSYALSQVTHFPGAYRLIALWVASLFLMPACAALAGLCGKESLSRTLNIVGVYSLFGGLSIGLILLLSRCVFDVGSHLLE